MGNGALVRGAQLLPLQPALGDSLAKAKARTDSIRADSLKRATKEKPIPWPRPA